MKIVLLDADTLGVDIDLSVFERFGAFEVFATTQANETIKHIADAQIVLTNKVVIDKKVMDACTNLKLICITATGMNNVDLEYAAKKGIEVKNAAGYSTASVTQTTFALALHLLMHTPYYDSFVKEGYWAKSEIFTHLDKPFWQIKDKCWGIIGLGNIGKEVAKVASAFGAKVLYYSTSGVKRQEAYEVVGLEELMKSCQIISIHAPLNGHTQNLIRKKELNMMQDGAILLNLGRGGIINEADLAHVLDEKEIYAGLDVVQKEPIEADNPLLHVQKQNRLVMTPHIAWASKESRQALMEIVFKNIEEFLQQ